MGEAYLEYAPKLVGLSLVRLSSNRPLANVPFQLGLHILHLQPGLRNQRRVSENLGWTWLQTNWQGQGRRASPLT